MTSPSPYLNARQEWLERYGSYIAARNQWRVVAICCLVIAALAVAGNVIQSLQYKIVPYIVEIDKLGATRAVSRADEMGAVPDRVIQAAVARFVVNWRTVTPDRGLQKRMIGDVAAFSTGPATGTLREWYLANNPYERGKDALVDVEIKSLPLPVGESSWRVEWLETTRNHSGVSVGAVKYEATVVVATSPPQSDQQIIINPSGTYVTSLSFSKLLVQEPS